jgi:hypothetical protein
MVIDPDLIEGVCNDGISPNGFRDVGYSMSKAVPRDNAEI